MPNLYGDIQTILFICFFIHCVPLKISSFYFYHCKIWCRKLYVLAKQKRKEEKKSPKFYSSDYHSLITIIKFPKVFIGLTFHHWRQWSVHYLQEKSSNIKSSCCYLRPHGKAHKVNIWWNKWMDKSLKFTFMLDSLLLSHFSWTSCPNSVQK